MPFRQTVCQCCAPPSFVRLAPRYFISSAAEPHVLTNNLQLPAKAQTTSMIYVCFSTPQYISRHLILPLCAYSMLHLASTSISSCLQAQRARNRRRALANRSQSRRSTPGLSPLSLREYLLQPLTISNCSLILHTIYTYPVCLIARPLPILLLCQHQR